MFLSILKKDLKRKKTMNCILLIFVLISAMFAASSVNNIVAVTNGIDYYFEKAGMSDLFVIAKEPEGEPVGEILEENSSVTGFRREQILRPSQGVLTVKGEDLSGELSYCGIMAASGAQLRYFDENDDQITDCPDGKVYVTVAFAGKAKDGIEKGDSLTFEYGDEVLELEVAGFVKDAFLGAEMMSNFRFLLSDDDYERLANAQGTSPEDSCGVYYIDTTDIEGVRLDIASGANILFAQPQRIIRMSYILYMLVAGILLIASVGLLIVSFVVMSFAISFTIAEDMHEIGVMKAVGLKNSSIRGLYLVKYLCISVVGAAIGFALSLPFSRMLLSSVSRNMVLGSDSSLLYGALSALGVVLLTLAFCWSFTGRIKKLSPVDAVRSGQTGERFHKKSLISRSRSRLSSTGFMALNDIFSSPKQFSLLTAVFTLCTLIVMILANAANTLKSEKILYLFGTTKSDVYITGSSDLFETDEELEEILEREGMPAKVHTEELYNLPVYAGDKRLSLLFQYCSKTSASDYVYEEGSAPQDSSEIALSFNAADALGVGVGDKVTITVNGREDKYMVTALMQSFCQLGEAGRLHESFDLTGAARSNIMGQQIDFTDSPDRKEILRRTDRIKEIFGEEKVFDAAGFVNDTARSADTVSSVKSLLLAVILFIVLLICVLMEHSFISREKQEIALMKALGFRTGQISAQHALRFVIVGAVSALIAAALCLPLTKLAIDPIFGIMGATKGVSYKLEPAEVFLLYPAIVTAAVAIGAWITSLSIKRIKASDTSGNE
ncbi:MAG: ABC transporter permease [Ruminococcus sp.]|nr:ABC transporter permease [Ruminococcus sp.]